MTSRFFVSVCVVAVALAATEGCRTVAEARKAQKAEKAFREGTAARPAPFACDVTGWTLPDYVSFALTNRPAVRAAELAVRDAEDALKQVRANRYAQVGGSVGYGQSTMNSGPHFSWRRKRAKLSGSLDLDLLLTDFGRVDALEKQARADLVAAQLALAETRLDVFSEVVGSYYSLRMADALLSVAATNEFEYAQHLERAETLLEVEEGVKLDVLRARLDLSQARLSAISASNDVAVSSAEFLNSLGLDASTGTRGGVMPPVANPLTDAVREFASSSQDATAALAFARTNSPSIAVLRARMAAADAEVDYAISDLYPELRLSSAFSFSDPTLNWSWGLRAVQSVFEGFRKTTAVDRAVTALRMARAAVETAEQALSRDLADAVSARDNARAGLVVARATVIQARENLALVREQYAQGEAGRVDCTTAVASLTSALGASVKAFYEQQVAEAKLVRLMGMDPVYLEERVKMGD